MLAMPLMSMQAAAQVSNQAIHSDPCATTLAYCRRHSYGYRTIMQSMVLRSH